MSNTPPRPSVQELGLQDREELTLYLELIRIIEKDIDEIKDADAKSGWTSWAVLGGIAGALLLLFGETRKLQSLPTQEIETIALAGILFYIVITLGYRLLYADIGIRPGRIRWSNDTYFSMVPSSIYSFVISIVCTWVALSLPLPYLVKIPTATAFILWSLLTALVLILSRLKFPFGNNRLSKKSGVWIGLITALLSIVGVVLLIARLTSPVGEAGTLPYLIAGLILSLLLLIGNLVYTRAPSRLLSNLQDLKNDIVFLRVEIDEALRRYEVLSEGETLPDALQKELSEVLSDLNVIEYAHSNMHRLLEKLSSELPNANDSPSIRQEKSKEISLDRDSYLLHDQKRNDVTRAVVEKLKALNKKMIILAAATEDFASANTIRSSLNERSSNLDRAHYLLTDRMRTIASYLSNPDRIPPELNESYDKPRSETP